MNIETGTRINLGSVKNPDFATVERITWKTAVVRSDDGAVMRLSLELVERLALAMAGEHHEVWGARDGRAHSTMN